MFHDSHPHKPERLTFAGVLAKSSNVGTIMASESISEQQLYQTLRDFGFGQKTGLPLPGETPGLLSRRTSGRAPTATRSRSGRRCR